MMPRVIGVIRLVDRTEHNGWCVRRRLRWGFGRYRFRCVDTTNCCNFVHPDVKVKVKNSIAGTTAAAADTITHYEQLRA